ncbi:hypothetical protein R1flu_026416 [Riccia fluitans]|uniref:Transmembrane protein n=1 Tax=Riccia fluitans TaxID=41844 RepID=A0ABD1XJY7_9MARC
MGYHTARRRRCHDRQGEGRSRFCSSAESSSEHSRAVLREFPTADATDQGSNSAGALPPGASRVHLDHLLVARRGAQMQKEGDSVWQVSRNQKESGTVVYAKSSGGPRAGLRGSSLTRGNASVAPTPLGDGGKFVRPRWFALPRPSFASLALAHRLPFGNEPSPRWPSLSIASLGSFGVDSPYSSTLSVFRLQVHSTILAAFVFIGSSCFGVPSLLVRRRGIPVSPLLLKCAEPFVFPEVFFQCVQGVPLFVPDSATYAGQICSLPLISPRFAVDFLHLG